MALRLTFLCHGATRSMRAGGFPAPDEPLDKGARRKLADARPALGTYDRIFASPAPAAGQTAAAAGVTPVTDDRLRDIGLGSWAGLGFEQVQTRDPAAFAAWLARPEEGVPGGESMAQVRGRVAEWLAQQAGSSSAILAITHPMVVRAALGHCLELPPASVMRFDIAPLSRVVLSHNRVWRLQTLG